MSSIVFAIAAQGVLLAVILMVMESRRPFANRLLAGILLTYSLRLASQVLHPLGEESYPTVFSIFLANSALLLGPLLYAYSRALMDDNFKLWPGHAKHLLPAILAVAWSLTDWAGYSGTLDTGVIRTSAVHGLCSSLSLALYCRAIFRRLHDYRRQLLDTHSAIERISLNWLRLLVGIILFVGTVSALVNIFILATGRLHSPIFLVVMPLSIVIFYAVAIFGFRQSSILLIGNRSAPVIQPDRMEPEQCADEEEWVSAAVKYARSGLDAQGLERIWQRIQHLMQEQALYRDSELPLAVLAEQLGVGSHTLSQVFNSHAGIKFYDYINGLRVNYAKSLLLDPHHERTTILEIALDAGFNTKSTFNKCFKQVVGLTPSAYRDQRRSGQPLERPSPHMEISGAEIPTRCIN